MFSTLDGEESINFPVPVRLASSKRFIPLWQARGTQIREPKPAWILKRIEYAKQHYALEPASRPAPCPSMPSVSDVAMLLVNHVLTACVKDAVSLVVNNGLSACVNNEGSGYSPANNISHHIGDLPSIARWPAAQLRAASATCVAGRRSYGGHS